MQSASVPGGAICKGIGEFMIREDGAAAQETLPGTCRTEMCGLLPLRTTQRQQLLQNPRAGGPRWRQPCLKIVADEPACAKMPQGDAGVVATTGQRQKYHAVECISPEHSMLPRGQCISLTSTASTSRLVP
jgi:hypothetical protein